jgi:hypothetical protein
MSRSRLSRAFDFQPVDDMGELTLIRQQPRVLFFAKNEEDELSEEQAIRHNRRVKRHSAVTMRNTYQEALTELESALRQLYGNAAMQTMFLSGFGVYREVIRIASAKNRDIPEQTLTDILISTRLLILGKERHPSGETGYKNEMDNYYKLSRHVSAASFGKAVAGIMLGILGAAILVASGVLSFASLGMLAPINVCGFVFGYSLMTAAVSGITTLFGGLGTTTLGNLLFFHATEKGALTQEMRLLESTARRKFI